MLDSVGSAPDDGGLLRLFVQDGDRAWQILLDRYGARLVGYLRALGYDRDAAMDRFVALCGKLRDNRYRRLREIRHLGRDGELLPWLFAVARRVAVDQTIAELGKQRLPRSIEALEAFDHEVFRAYFWQGMRPSEICEDLARSGNEMPDPLKVYEALERILQRLGSPRIWRLVAQRARAATPTSLVEQDATGSESGGESYLLRQERVGLLTQILAALPPRQRNLLRLRYGESLGLEDLARQLGLDSREVRSELRRALRAARSLAAQRSAEARLVRRTSG